MEKNLSILTNRQRTAYELRQQGMTYKQIAEEMGISLSAASQNVKGAERRFREYEAYTDIQKRNLEPIEFPLTRGELKAIIAGLQLLEDKIYTKVNGGLYNCDWMNRLPYEMQIVCSLRQRSQETLGYSTYWGKLSFPEDWENWK